MARFAPLLSARRRRWMAALLLSCLVPPARAHDTWFQPLRQGAAGALLSLATGNRYPRQEYPIGPEQLRSNGCRATDGQALPLDAVQVQPHALLLRAGAAAPPQAVTCWAQLMPFEVEIAPDLVPVYLDEIQASDALRQRWAGLQARGLPWKERYTKNARIELAGAGMPIVAKPVPMGLDLLLDAGGQPLRVDRPLAFTLLLDGRPLAGQPLELVDAQGRSAGWQTTDAQGAVRITVAAAGRWLLRGTWLRASPDQPDAWDSRFVTLVFEVPP